MADVFLEVDEQLRSARLQALFRKTWPYVTGAIVAAGLVSLGVWGVEKYQTDAAAKSSLAYADAATALSSGDAKLAEQRFAALAKTGAPAFKALALMQQAGAKLKADDGPGAGKLLDQAAAVAPNPVIGDAARLQAAYVLMDTAGYDDIYARLKPLTDAKRPYHALAQEALAIERLAAGHSAEARADFQVLALSLDSSEATRARANAALALIKDHADASVAAIAKGAIGLTPMAPPAVPGGGQMIQAPAQAEPQTAEPQTGAAQ